MEKSHKKESFKMPHLLWIMLGIILLSCLCTYIIPAGQYVIDATGKSLALNSTIWEIKPRFLPGMLS